MARYKYTDAENGQSYFLPVNLKAQLLPGTFEYMLNDLINDGTIDVSIFDKNYKNDATGATAIPPAALIKLIIYGYRKGIKSSRALDELAVNNIIAKALTGDLQPHWTTIADFISGNSEKFQEIFVKVLAFSTGLGLAGGEDYAIDGLRLPSNASMEMSGTEEELKKRMEIYRRMAEKHAAGHRKEDESGRTDKQAKETYDERRKRLKRQAEKIRCFLEGMEKKEGKKNEEIKSNVTDNESAMIHSSKGFIRGYIGIAVADKKNQIIVNAQAVGSANEGEHLPDILDTTLNNLKEAGLESNADKKPVFTMDANYFSEDNLKSCEERGVETVIADPQHRKRLESKEDKQFEVDDFIYHEEGNCYECPNGKRLEFKKNSTLGEAERKTYQAGLNDCRTCPMVGQCIKTKKEMNELKQGKRIILSKSNEIGNLSAAMREKLETEEAQNIYAYRIQIIEPVFSSIAYCKGLNRFMLRGKKKVNGQWKLYCIVHNLTKCLGEYNKKRDYA
jgi:transposase